MVNISGLIASYSMYLTQVSLWQEEGGGGGELEVASCHLTNPKPFHWPWNTGRIFLVYLEGTFINTFNTA